MTTGTAQDQGPKILVVCWILVIVPGLIVGLRFYCKVMLSRGFGWDDATILVAWTLQLIYTAMITQSVKLGVVGKHVNSIPAREAIPEALKLVYISFVIIIIGCVLSKTSFALTLLRIITKTWMKVLLWYIIISMNAIMWLCAICYLIQCSPTAALWDIRLMKTANCWPTIVFEAIALAAGVFLVLASTQSRLMFNFTLSLFWSHGRGSRSSSLARDLEIADATPRKVRHCAGNEHGDIVRSLRRQNSSINAETNSKRSASITAFIKTSQLVNVAHLHDFTCTPKTHFPPHTQFPTVSLLSDGPSNESSQD
ncbi:hypothetical protein N7539_004815 [Penicillium diatomitis]|uniref:Rhodopsin domain-containing protein n=1 Tax=Penicillium diatomitis TaxID=2819901 RepID=A0A9W9X5W3_9EURO|nr:uncharacterized protein N7539_004815 [Penicillium diatomitis]KAJ5484827.1 hypothetical protein N7539_004815 [Penicillium diatomitis]